MQIAVIQFPHHNGVTELMAALQRIEVEVLDFSWEDPVERLTSADGYIIIGEESTPNDKLIATLKTQNALGKPLLGLCSGAAFLINYGLVPGLWDNRPAISLASDQSPAHIRLSRDYQYNAYTRYLSLQHILPVRAATQQFIVPPGLLLELESQGLDVFHYGEAPQKIAAIANKAGNTMAMLADPTVSLEGDILFKSMKDHIASGYKETVDPLYYWKR